MNIKEYCREAIICVCGAPDCNLQNTYKDEKPILVQNSLIFHAGLRPHINKETFIQLTHEYNNPGLNWHPFDVVEDKVELYKLMVFFVDNLVAVNFAFIGECFGMWKVKLPAESRPEVMLARQLKLPEKAIAKMLLIHGLLDLWFTDSDGIIEWPDIIH